jgi:hypothetical protein
LRQVHVDAPLTNISVAFYQQASNFVAGQVFPNVPVQKQSDVYYVWDRASFNRDEAKKRAPGTRSAQAGVNLSTQNYSIDVWALSDFVADQVAANADSPLNLEAEKARVIMNKLMIRKERDWVENFFTTGKWATDIGGVDSSPSTGEVLKWSDYEGGDPIGDIRKARTDMLEATGYEVNTMVLNQRVMDALVDHPDIIDRIKYSGGVGNQNPARTTSQALSQLFEIDRILVSKANVNAAAEGDAEDANFIMSSGALLCHSAPTPGLGTPSAGYTFSWNGYMGQTNGFGIATSRWREDPIRATWVEGEMAFDHHIVAQDLGIYFNAIV